MSQGVGFVHPGTCSERHETSTGISKIFTSARAAVERNVKPHQPNRDTDPRSNSQPKPNRPNTGPNWNQHPGRGLCYLCQKPGNRAAACPTGRPQRYDDRMRQPVHNKGDTFFRNRVNSTCTLSLSMYSF